MSERVDMEAFFDRLWPLHRSLTGEGNRQTLAILQEIIPLEIDEIPSGTECFDWEVPPEWRVRQAWIKSPQGEKIIDIQNSNLHLLGYSIPFHGFLPLEKLQQNLYSLPEQPTAIPYLCSYYHRRWGFCLTHEQREHLTPGIYEVNIETDLDENGSMSLAQSILAGESQSEILLSSYICHPSMANNEISGPLILSFLYQRVKAWKRRRLSYRFLLAPETIGSIAFLAQYGEHLKLSLKAGFVLTTIGDGGPWSLRHSRRANTDADRAMQIVLAASGEPYSCEDFDVDGSDERQYCSPGFNLPVVAFSRTRFGKYPQYHTSLDNKSLMDFDKMIETLNLLEDALLLLDANRIVVNICPYGEPMLGKRGLYPQLTTQTGKETLSMRAMKWVLNLADGDHDLIDICQRSGLPVREILAAVDLLLEHQLLQEV